MKKQSIILRVLLVISIISVVIFSTALIRESQINRQSRAFYTDMLAGTESRPGEQENRDTENHRDTIDNLQKLQDDTQNAQWMPYVDFDSLYEAYPGIVAWIRLENTQIDYPVMQYTDNDYFLSRLPDGTSHRSGSIFLDYRNNSDFSDKSILIYGHMSSAQEMFTPLRNYREQIFFEANPVIYLYTPHHDYKIILFAAYLAHSQYDHPPLYFENDEAFLSYVEGIKSISLFRSDLVVGTDAIIVSLCTCAYDFDEARLVITGILVEV